MPSKQTVSKSQTTTKTNETEMKECPYCHSEFQPRGYKSHFKHCKSNPDNKGVEKDKDKNKKLEGEDIQVKQDKTAKGKKKYISISNILILIMIVIIVILVSVMVNQDEPSTDNSNSVSSEPVPAEAKTSANTESEPVEVKTNIDTKSVVDLGVTEPLLDIQSGEFTKKSVYTNHDTPPEPVGFDYFYTKKYRMIAIILIKGKSGKAEPYLSDMEPNINIFPDDPRFKDGELDYIKVVDDYGNSISGLPNNGIYRTVDGVRRYQTDMWVIRSKSKG